MLFKRLIQKLTSVWMHWKLQRKKAISTLTPLLTLKINSSMANPHKAKGRITVKPDRNGKTQLGQMKPNKKK